MVSEINSPEKGSQQSINGVSLYTRKREPKTRYSRSEYLRIFGATEDDFDQLCELFFPRGPYFALRLEGRSWFTPKAGTPGKFARLRDLDVFRHLLGNSLPGRLPQWVAPRSWGTTQWVGIDVDYRGDLQDFLRRCQKVRKALYRLGVPKKAWLVSRTPSGGKHYRFFLTRHIQTKDIPYVLELVGLKHVPGQIEFFPARERGLTAC